MFLKDQKRLTDNFTILNGNNIKKTPSNVFLVYFIMFRIVWDNLVTMNKPLILFLMVWNFSCMNTEKQSVYFFFFIVNFLCEPNFV